MLTWIDHEIAKRCTKYKTNLETRSNHFSQREQWLEKLIVIENEVDLRI